MKFDKSHLKEDGIILPKRYYTLHQEKYVFKTINFSVDLEHFNEPIQLKNIYTTLLCYNT
jgi:hypothetical protein